MLTRVHIIPFLSFLFKKYGGYIQVDPDQGEPNQSKSETRFEQCVSDPDEGKFSLGIDGFQFDS